MSGRSCLSWGMRPPRDGAQVEDELFEGRGARARIDRAENRRGMDGHGDNLCKRARESLGAVPRHPD